MSDNNLNDCPLGRLPECWTLNLINAHLTTLKDAKVTSQLDDKSVLEVKGLHQEVLAEQKLGLEK